MVIEFYHSWCEHVKRITPELEQIPHRYPSVIMLRVLLHTNTHTQLFCHWLTLYFFRWILLTWLNWPTVLELSIHQRLSIWNMVVYWKCSPTQKYTYSKRCWTAGWSTCKSTTLLRMNDNSILIRKNWIQ